MRILSQLFILMLLSISALHAAESNTERFSISIGAFITDRNTDARLDSETLGIGSNIDFEDDLDLDSSGTVFRLDSYYRFNRRHRIDFAIFDLSRDSSAVIDEKIQFGDDVFNVNTTVSAEFDLLIAKLGYTYSFLVRDKGYLGATIGLYTASTKVSISEPNLGTAESRDLTAPLPVIGLRGEYQFAPRWTVRGSGEFFKVEIDNVEGSLVDVYVGVDYSFSDRFAFGIGYNNVSIDVDSSNSDFTGELDWSYDGALIYLKSDFGNVK